MRKFRHKTLGWIAKYMEQEGNIVNGRYYINDDENDTISKELIEDSADREEIKDESDWKLNLSNDIDGLYGKPYTKIDLYQNFIKALDKHLPKITDNMIEKMYKQCFATPTKEYFIEIIKQNLPKDLLANPE